MIRTRKKWPILAAMILGMLILGNPTEGQFLRRVTRDFGSIHHGMKLTTTQLKAMGESDHRSFFLFSLYDYQFGNIRVSYLGIAFYQYYLGSSTEATLKTPQSPKSITI